MRRRACFDASEPVQGNAENSIARTIPYRSAAAQPDTYKKGNKRVSACSLMMTEFGNSLRSVIPERPPPALAGLFVFAFLAVIATFASLILVPGLVAHTLAFLRLL
jgi:hypothetical protein